MQYEFLNKIRNNEYISNLLYENIKNNYKEIIPHNFNIDIYNNIILNKNYNKYLNYFNEMYKDVDENIHLDEEQIKAILADEDYSLIIAGAGTGKTTTMVSKVKYLVEIKHVDPSKILVMSYTKKAVEELEKRLVYDFNLEVVLKTFHSLGFDIIKRIYKNHTPYVVDENNRNEIFLKWFKEKIFKNKSLIVQLINSFNKENTNNSNNWYFSKEFQNNYKKYNTFDEYFDNYKKRKLNETEDIEKTIKNIIEKDINDIYPKTIKGELVKSKGEAIIANFLYINNIDYEYEKVYNEILPNYKVYKPDFTINIAGNNIYIEYFGLSNYKKNELKTYEKIKALKIKYHEEKHNKFIKIDYKQNEDIEAELEKELKKLNIKLTKKSNIEILNTILERNKLAEIFPLKELFYDVIDKIKSSINKTNYQQIIYNYIECSNGNKTILKNQFKFINDFYVYYQNYLFKNEKYGFDYADMIYYAKKNINSEKINDLIYDYVIIDEYQDISEERYELAYSLINKNKSKVTAVGDDWQTIYSFSGSKIEYIYNFQKYFKGAKLFKITTTYRNPKGIVNISSEFIMKNKNQIQKDLKSYKDILNPIKFITFDTKSAIEESQILNNKAKFKEINYFKEIEKLKELINQIYKSNPEHNILILSRRNNDIERLFNDPYFKDDIGTKITIETLKDIEIDAMTIHKSKGLSRDEVIIIGLNESFPVEERDEYWIIELFKNKKIEESIKDAEERRVFYVALTRTKNNVYLLTSNISKYRSKFIDEIYQLMH